MDGTIESNKTRWLRYQGQLPTNIETQRQTCSLISTSHDDIWNFDNASESPWIGAYKPTSEAVGTHYGTFWVMRNPSEPLPDTDYASSYGEITYVNIYDPSAQPLMVNGAAVFTITTYDLNFYTPAEKVEILNNLAEGRDVTICNSLLFNNIPFYRVDEHDQVNIHDETSYMGTAYKNGIFYQEPIDLSNPYEDYPAEDEGGPGTNDWDSDPIPERDLPSDFFSNSGLVTVWTPTTTELRDFGNYLWSNNGLDLNQLKKIVNNPFDLVLGLQWLPLNVTIAGQKPLNVGNILGVDTGLQMSYPTHENYRFDFGEINSGLFPESQSFVAYAPYTRMSISIPFIGKQAIDADLIRKNLPINLKMKYNIVTGTICAYLYGANQTLLYQWLGSIPATIPVAQNDQTTAIAGMMSIAAGAVGGAVTGAVVGGVGGAVVGGLTNAVSGAASADLKPTVTTTGSYSGNGASLNASSYAFIEVLQANLSVDNKHKHYLGLPRNVSGKIKDNYGFNSIKAARVDSKRATDSERAEIKQILEGGYIYGDLDKKSATPKPSVIADDSLQFMLYQNASSNERIDKSLTHLHTYSTLTLKEPTSIQSPTLRLSAGDTNLKKGNYGYIPKFDRFYYVTDVRSVPGGLWEVDLKCDVLMSFRDDIIDNTVLFNHSEGNYNLYLNDGTLQVDSRPRVKLKAFPNHFGDSDGTYVLIMAGGNLT